MDDAGIIALYWERNEDAICQTDAAYGRSLYILSDKIVHSHEDAQECVNDTYSKAWDTIPPQRPVYFFAYLAKICRNFSLGRLERRNAAKRSADIVSLTQELEQCIPDRSHDRKQQSAELGALLNRFLESLPKESRLIFMRRYWYADSIQEIAQRYSISQSKVKTQLYRCRGKLQQFLEREGVAI